MQMRVVCAHSSALASAHCVGPVQDPYTTSVDATVCAGQVFWAVTAHCRGWAADRRGDLTDTLLCLGLDVTDPGSDESP